MKSNLVAGLVFITCGLVIPLSSRHRYQVNEFA